MNVRAFARFSVTFLSFAIAACSGGGDGGGVPGTGGDFVVLRTTPPNNGKLFLNESIQLDFSNKVDLATADLNTVSFQVFDLNGNPLTERPAGSFALARAAGDDEVGRRLVFSPRFPTNNAFTDGGFKPGRVYLVSLVGGDARNNTVLKDQNNKPLSQPISFQFRTADGATPSELFSDTLPGGPRRSGFSVTPSTAGTQPVAPLNLFGRESVEVRLRFDQPLNPQDTNVPVNISADPTKRDPSARGRIYLEYDDPLQPRAWIPSTVELETNSRAGSVVVLRPIGVLPNNAEVRVVVTNTVEDMSGESNASDPAYNEVFATFRTQTEFPPQYDALVENFVVGDNSVDFGAAFLEPFAAIQNGKLSASFDFEGTSTTLEYQPTVREVILNTDFTTITPRNNPPINVTGGVFNFSEVLIGESVSVKGTGTNPMVWLCSGNFTVNGTLSVSGGAGERVDTLNSANFPTPGGIGACGGGNGGRGSPNATDRSQSGEAGFGPGQRPGGGGEGGALSCTSTCNRGAGGGGGSLGTKGDPYYPPTNTATWGQVGGEGGRGCLNRSQPGGAAGGRPFSDSRPENDFWGTGVNVWRSIRIQGELLAPVGGAGGGGGGDRAPRCNSGDPNFASDNKGGGGGAGAGVLIVKALGKIIVGPTGKITAEGGNGGGGEQAGGNDQGGGGGGGSGGMIILMAGQGFEIFVHGNELATPPRSTYGELDYNFAISADGGIGTQGRFSGTEISNKYPPGTAATWDARPTGGFGGMGIVQLMAPPGDDADGTGNRLDDNIDFVYVDGTGARQSVSPSRKKALLAWRGWPDSDGMLKDDDGVVLSIGKMEGDIRPSPVMLPSPFGPLSRARSRWVDMGFAVRTPVVGTPDPNTPRVVQIEAGANPPAPDFGDPDLGYAGTLTNASELGYSAYDNATQSYPSVQFNGSEVLPILTVDTGAELDGQAVYAITLDPSASLGTIANRYVNYRAQPLDAGDATIGSTRQGGGPVEFRVLAHDERTLIVEPNEDFPSTGVKLRIAAKFFEVYADNNRETLGGLSGSHPSSNVRIGFAFSTDPRDTTTGERYPTNPGEFVFDLQDPLLLTFLETRRPKYVQWDALFNIRYDPNTTNNISGEPLSQARVLPALEYLVLPYRF